MAVREFGHFACGHVAGDDGPAAGTVGIAQAGTVGVDDKILIFIGSKGPFGCDGLPGRSP